MDISLVIIYAIACLCFGVTDTLWKKPSDKLNVFQVIIVRSFCTSILFGLTYFFIKHFQIQISKVFYTNIIISNTLLLQAIGICFINYFGLFFYLKSIQNSKVALVVGFNKIGIVISVLVAFFYYKEPISNFKILSIGFLLFGLFIIEKNTIEKKGLFSKGLTYTFLSRLFWSTWVFFIPIINSMGVILFSFILECTVCLTSIILYVISTHINPFSNLKQIKPYLIEFVLLVILGYIAILGCNVAIGSLPIIFMLFFKMIEPSTSLLLSTFYLKEKINKMQWVGIGVGLIGLIIVSL